MKRKSLGLILITAALLATYSSPRAATPTDAKPVSGKILNVRLVDPPVNLDWNGLSTFIEAPFILNLCEGLYTYSYPGGKLVPGIAASLTKSKDLTEYTFKLRTDAKWSDGRPIYAQDFIDAWTRLVSPQATSIYTYYLFDVVGAKEYNTKAATSATDIGVKALDDHTLQVKLKRPVKNWEANTAFWPLYPIRKDQIERFGSNWWRAGVLVSSGPFIFDSYEAGKKAVLKRNPFYSRFKSNVDEIDFWLVDDQIDALKRYKEGFFDFLWGLPYSVTSKFKGSSDFQMTQILRGQLLGLNTEKYPMSNKEFRLAILSSLNPAKLIPAGADQLVVGQTLIPPPLPGSKKPTVVKFDPQAAKEHLKKSGVIIKKGSQIRLLTGIAEPYMSVGKLIQNQLNQVLGFNIELAALQTQEYTAYMNLGDYNATLIGWTAKVPSPQDFLLPYSGDAAYNRMHFKNPFYDEWIFEGAQATTEAAASDAFYHAQKVVAEDEGVLLPLFFEKSANLVRPKLKHLYFNHQGIPILKDVEINAK
jgi:oligopeptide transport system substrate-binding protein